jgi:hypothetical protein
MTMEWISNGSRTNRVRNSLSLEDFLLDGSGRLETVDETLLLLPITPDTRQGLLITCTVEEAWSSSGYELNKVHRNSRVPCRIEQDQTVGTDQVDTTSTSFTTEQEDEFFPFRIIEAVDQLLTLVYVHGTVQPQASVPDALPRFSTR